VVNVKEGTGQGTTPGPTLCNFFFLPILLKFERNMAESRTTATTPSEGEGKSGNEIGTFTHNFADDTCTLAGTLGDACKVAKGYNLCLRKFRSCVQVATKEVPKSKSVAVYVPAKTETKCKQEKIFVNDDESQWIDFVETSACLGSHAHTELSDEKEMRARISKALSPFDCLRRHLLSSKDVWNEVKRTITTGTLLPIMLDGAETWVVSAQSLRELKVAHNVMVRGCPRCSLCTTRKHRIGVLYAQDMQDRLGIHPL
jgi:hypothetical protein